MNPSPPHTAAATDGSRRLRAESLLLLTAGALLALTAWAWLTGPLTALRATPAIADIAVAQGDHALLTSEGSGGDDVLIVLDQRTEELLLYRPRNGRTIDFQARYPLRELFTEARATGAITPMPEPERTPGSTPTPPGAPRNPAR